MSNATDYAPCICGDRSRAWRQAARDVVDGAMATARFFVTLAGCVALVAAAAIIGNPPVRERLLQHVQAPRWIDSAAAAVAEVESTPEAGAARTAVVDEKTAGEQRNITQYLARRYRVADAAVRVLVAAAFETGQTVGLDPLLILAVMAIESSMNPFAQSPVGAQGLMQVMTRLHTEKFEVHGGEHAALDPIANIKVGSAILGELIRRGGSVERGLQLYVGAGNLPDDGGYAARVLGERSRIAMAAAGRVDAAIVASYRASQPVDAKPAAPAQEGPTAKPTAAAEPQGKADKAV
jgi:soluble lytic murein transglycosylase-like protein